VNVQPRLFHEQLVLTFDVQLIPTLMLSLWQPRHWPYFLRYPV